MHQSQGREMEEVSASAVDPKCVGVICTKCNAFQERRTFFLANYKGLEVLSESINDLSLTQFEILFFIFGKYSAREKSTENVRFCIQPSRMLP